jgi:vacuolar-type H+-ATPase subunit I/STV1
MLELGGVPTEERFQKLTEVQWAFIMQKYMEMKAEKQDTHLSMLEYLAKMTSMNPKIAFEIAEARRKNMEKMKKEREREDQTVVAETEVQVVKNYNTDGEIVNTSFDDAIRAAMGESDDSEAALKAILGDEYSGKKTVYTMDKSSLEYFKNHGDLEKRMQQIMQQASEKPLDEAPPKLLPEEVAALKALEFDTIEF